MRDSKFITDYFINFEENKCFKAGINQNLSSSIKKCVCNSNYIGEYCSIPKILENATIEGAPVPISSYTLRSKPRRVISSLPFNHEFELLEARLNDLNDVVDVFIIQESNFTNSGGRNELKLKKFLDEGKFRDKVIYLERTDPPSRGFIDGEYADGEMRRHLSQEGLKRLSEVKLDDLFIYNDSDEIPKADILLFLKLHDGFPHQIALNLIWSLYGFFWQVTPGKPRYDTAIMTIQFFRDFHQYDASRIRSDLYTKADAFAKYKEMNEDVLPLHIPRSGWHCSWCFSPEGIRKKLLDAPNSDFPRYGDYPGKTEPKYIERLIKYGLYFDLSPIGSGQMVNMTTDPEFAPPYILQNKELFRNLLVNPYTNVELPRVKR